MSCNADRPATINVTTVQRDRSLTVTVKHDESCTHFCLADRPAIVRVHFAEYLCDYIIVSRHFVSSLVRSFCLFYGVRVALRTYSAPAAKRLAFKQLIPAIRRRQARQAPESQ